MKSCSNCRWKSEKLINNQVACGLPGVPRNWNSRDVVFDDIAKDCSCYQKEVSELA